MINGNISYPHESNGEKIAFRAWEAGYLALAEQCHQGVLLIDDKGIITYCNNLVESIFECSAIQIIGQSFFQFLPKTHHLRLHHPTKTNHSVILKDNAKMLIPLKGKPSGIKWLEISVFNINFGELKKTSVIIYDRTEFEQMKRLAKEGLKIEFTEEVDEGSTNLMIIRVRPNGTILFFNRKCEEITGYNKKEVLGKNWFNFFLAPEKKKISKKCFLRGSLASPFLCEIKTKAGEFRTISWVNSLVYDGRGKINELIGFGTDITTLKYLQEEVKSSGNPLTKFSDDSTDYIDFDHNFPTISNSPRFTGYKINELMGKEHVFLFHTEGNNKFESFLNKMMGGEISSFGSEPKLKDSNKVNLEAQNLKQDVGQSKVYQIKRVGTCELIGNSDEFREVLNFSEKVAKSPDTSVLIEGETGTGKEMVSLFIHFSSDRKLGPFICLNCGAIPGELMESELFGYEKGSFTGSLKDGKMGKFELADCGTLLLDEITDLPLNCQSKLLRVLETKKFYRIGGIQEITPDVRIIALTNKDINKLVEEGKFRQDLYYRLSVVRISIPPLRERKEDIIPLSKYFMIKYNQKFNKNFKVVSPQAEQILLNHSWKGNIRELRNVIEGIILTSEGETILPSHFKNFFFIPSWQSNERTAQKPQLPPDGIVLDDHIKNLVEQAVKRTGGNKTHAAQLLGISRPTFLYRLKKYGTNEGMGIGKKRDVKNPTGVR